MLLEEGEVLAGQLVLQGLGGGGHDRAAPGEDGRHQVGERLAGAGARLHRDVLALGDAEAHGVGHLALPEPGLAAARQLGHHPLEGDGDGIRHRIDATGAAVTVPPMPQPVARLETTPHTLPPLRHDSDLALEGVLVPGVEEVGVDAVDPAGGQLEARRVAGHGVVDLEDQLGDRHRVVVGTVAARRCGRRGRGGRRCRGARRPSSRGTRSARRAGRCAGTSAAPATRIGDAPQCHAATAGACGPAVAVSPGDHHRARPGRAHQRLGVHSGTRAVVGDRAGRASPAHRPGAAPAPSRPRCRACSGSVVSPPRSAASGAVGVGGGVAEEVVEVGPTGGARVDDRVVRSRVAPPALHLELRDAALRARGPSGSTAGASSLGPVERDHAAHHRRGGDATTRMSRATGERRGGHSVGAGRQGDGVDVDREGHVGGGLRRGRVGVGHVRLVRQAPGSAPSW